MTTIKIIIIILIFTQDLRKKNIADEFKNKKRVGNIKSITIYESYIDEEITFPSIKHFSEYSGHTCVSGSLKHMTKNRWFKERCALIRKERVETIESYKSLIKEIS